ncbi:unnamed protein product [Adineta steineri]|uniref:DUF3494 domain-containing protein n=1 Tax=Adineta steineri TaxID=433720 RepID=A0A814MQ18_9BILA|nr:unnamed protein product [Adineta steineri]CAF1081975.1 unnamed protein product [Adineta steineri]
MRFISLIRASLMVVIIAFIVCSSGEATQYVNGSTIFGRCADVAIQAGSAISFNGVETYVVCGRVSISPGTSITGMRVLGESYTEEVNTPVAVNCAADELTAYGNLKGLTCTNLLANSDLSGMTLSPGVYCTGSGVFTLKATNLTLDAQGDSSAQFIFQMATTLITSVNTNIILVNGAQSNNTYWQVGSSATLGDNSYFIGQILAYASITVGPTANVTGRLFAQAAVTCSGANAINLSGLC